MGRKHGSTAAACPTILSRACAAWITSHEGTVRRTIPTTATPHHSPLSTSLPTHSHLLPLSLPLCIPRLLPPPPLPLRLLLQRASLRGKPHLPGRRAGQLAPPCERKNEWLPSLVEDGPQVKGIARPAGAKDEGRRGADVTGAAAVDIIVTVTAATVSAAVLAVAAAHTAVCLSPSASASASARESGSQWAWQSQQRVQHPPGSAVDELRGAAAGAGEEVRLEVGEGGEGLVGASAGQINGQRGRQAGGRTDRQTGRQANRQTNRQADREEVNERVRK